MTETRPLSPLALLRHARALVFLLSVAALASCESDTTITPPVPPGDLPPGDWFMHTANGNTLPGAEIARRFVGVIDEQTLLDSARIQVNDTGTWEQRYWMRVLHNGVLDRSELVIDQGTWAESGAANAFVSTLRARNFTVTLNADTRFTSVEPMVSFANATAVTGVYRTTRP